MDILIRDIPNTVCDEIFAALSHYIVPIYAIAGTSAPWWLGSGTFVEVAGRHGILTAAHVWDAIRDADQIGLVLTEFASTFTIPRDTISVRELKPGDEPEWGPDLALLLIPDAFVGRIAAHRSSVNLTRHRANFIATPPNSKSLWALTGSVREDSFLAPSSDPTVLVGNFPARAFFTAVDTIHERGDFDYIDTGARVTLPRVPSTFGGLSGGGLWELRGLSMVSGKIAWDGTRYLRGVAFWESAESEGRRIIRSHGPRSVFRTAWEAWGLPV